MAKSEAIDALELRKQSLISQSDQLRRSLALECEHLKIAGVWVEKGIYLSFQARRVLELATPVLQLTRGPKWDFLKMICGSGRNALRTVTRFCD